MIRTKLRLLSLVLMLVAALWGCATTPPQAKTENPEEKFGIKVVSLRLTANSTLLDFRYRVLDPDKAGELLKRSNKPYLIDQESGAKFAVPNMPKIGHLRQSAVKPAADRNYFVLFANPGKFITSGKKVTVVIGGFKMEDLVVE